MRISIFHLTDKTSYKDEYTKIIKVLNSKCVSFNKKNYTYFEFINTFLFNNWKFRGTYLDCYEYLEFIGVNLNSKKISFDSFINFIEFILNIQLLINSLKHYSENTLLSVKCKSILLHNIPLILDRLGYQAYELEDKVLIYKKDIEYSDLFNIVPDEIHELLLSYKSINNNGIKSKRIILNKIYLFMCNDIEKYKNYNSTLFNSIKLIVNKMGVVGDIDKKYSNLTNYKLRKYYDYCFDMMCYLIKTEEILKYKDEIREL